MSKRDRELDRDKFTQDDQPEGLLALFCKIFIWLGALVSLWIPYWTDNATFFPFVGPKSIVFMAAAEIMFFAWLILAIYYPKYRPNLNILFKALLFYLVILSISTIFGVDPLRSFWSKYERMTGLLMQMHLFAYFVALSSTLKKRWHWIVIISCSLVLAMIMCGYFFLFRQATAMYPQISATAELQQANSFWISIYNQFRNSQGGLFLGNKSFMGTYLMFNAFLALFLFFTSLFDIKSFELEGDALDWAKYVLPFFTGVSFVVIGIVLKLASARAMFVSFLGGMALAGLIVLSFKLKGQIKKVFLGILLAFMIISAGFIVSIFWAQSPLNNIYNIHEQFYKSGGGARLLIWELVWPQILQRPIFGWGPENFELAFYKVFDPRLFLPQWGSEVWFDRAHNIFVDYLISTGFLGLITFLSTVIAAAWVLYQRYFKKGDEFWALATIAPLLAAYVVQNFTVFDMVSSLVMLYFTFGFVGSLAEGDSRDKKLADPKPDPYNMKLAMAIFVGVFFIFCFSTFILRAYAGDVATIDIIQQYGSVNPQFNTMRPDPNLPSAQFCMAGSEKLSDRCIDYRIQSYTNDVEGAKIGSYQIRDYVMDTFIDFSQRSQMITQNNAGFKREMDFWLNMAKLSVQQSPYDYRARLKLGYMYGIYGITLDQGKLAESESVLEAAKEMSPRNPHTYWYLAQTKLFMNKPQEAIEQAQKAIDLNEDVVQSYMTAIQISKTVKNVDLAKQISMRGVVVYSAKINNDPESSYLYLTAIQIAKAGENFDVAKQISMQGVDVFRKKLDLDKGNPQLYLTAIQIAKAGENFDVARQIAIQGVEFFRDSSNQKNEFDQNLIIQIEQEVKNIEELMKNSSGSV